MRTQGRTTDEPASTAGTGGDPSMCVAHDEGDDVERNETQNTAIGGHALRAPGDDSLPGARSADPLEGGAGNDTLDPRQSSKKPHGDEATAQLREMQSEDRNK